MSLSERTPGYRNRSQVPPMSARPSRIAYVRPGQLAWRWYPAPIPEMPAPTTITSKCSTRPVYYDAPHGRPTAPIDARREDDSPRASALVVLLEAGARRCRCTGARGVVRLVECPRHVG